MNWKDLNPEALDRDELLAVVTNLRLELDRVTKPLDKEIRQLKTQLANEKRKVKEVHKKYRLWRARRALPPEED